METTSNNNNNDNCALSSALSQCSKRFTTLCGGLWQTAYLGANFNHAVHNLLERTV